MPQTQYAAIISEYKALVEPYEARGRSDAARIGLANIVSRYGAAAVEAALAEHVAQYERRGL